MFDVQSYCEFVKRTCCIWSFNLGFRVHTFDWSGDFGVQIVLVCRGFHFLSFDVACKFEVRVCEKEDRLRMELQVRL